MTQVSRAVVAFTIMASIATLASCSYPSAEDEADQVAAASARADIETLGGRVAGYLKSAATEGLTPSRALPGARTAGGSGVTDVRLLSSSAQGSDIRLDVAVARSASTGGGLDSGDATIRVCARITAPVALESAPRIEDLACPSGLPQTSAGSSISATASYHP